MLTSSTAKNFYPPYPLNLGPDYMIRVARTAGLLWCAGWPGCHVIAKLIFVAFNKHADEIPANSNQPG